MMVRSLTPGFYRGISKAVVLKVHKSIIRTKRDNKKKEEIRKMPQEYTEYRNVQESRGYL